MYFLCRLKDLIYTKFNIFNINVIIKLNATLDNKSDTKQIATVILTCLSMALEIVCGALIIYQAYIRRNLKQLCLLGYPTCCAEKISSIESSDEQSVTCPTANGTPGGDAHQQQQQQNLSPDLYFLHCTCSKHQSEALHQLMHVYLLYRDKRLQADMKVVRANVENVTLNNKLQQTMKDLTDVKKTIENETEEEKLEALKANQVELLKNKINYEQQLEQYSNVLEETKIIEGQVKELEENIYQMQESVQHSKMVRIENILAYLHFFAFIFTAFVPGLRT